MNDLGLFSLEGKVAIVTGGGTGLGREICFALASEGASVALCGRRKGPIEEVAAKIRKMGRSALAIPTDVTDSKQVNDLVRITIEELGKIDILVNNAGIAKGVDASHEDGLNVKLKEIWELSDEDWSHSINTNLTGAFYFCRAVARQMIAQGGGKVINMTSVGGLRAVKGAIPYCSAKAGVIMLTKTLAITWATHNIQVNCVAPGFFPIADIPPDQKAKIERFLPLGRFGKPRDIGPLAVYLSSEASQYVTGECFVIDGAASAGYAPTGHARI
jgi:NAD(P)-dependent dehydrogenase (short-subunit alcohol dehydrogenase family)